MKSPFWILPGRRVQFQRAAVKAPISIGALQELAHFARGIEGSWITLLSLLGWILSRNQARNGGPSFLSPFSGEVNRETGKPPLLSKLAGKDCIEKRLHMAEYSAMFTDELCQPSVDFIKAGKPFALATVVRSSGSTPQKAGAAALIEPNGRIHGTLGGGCLEAECRQRALRSLDLLSPLVFDLKLDEVEGWDDGLICGGRVRVLINPQPADNLKTYQRLLDACQTDQPGFLVTTIAHREQAVGESRFYLEQELKESADWDREKTPVNLIEFDSPKAVRNEDNQAEYFVEAFMPSPKLLIAGAGHIGKATSHFGRLLGFQVTVIDDRTTFANSDNLPDAHQVICGDIPKEVSDFPIDENTFIVIVTRGHRHDGQVLAACVHSKARFIGMIGSRRKSMLIRKGIVDEGIATEEEVNRVVSPIGLEIGSLTVNEIALSIASQLVSYRRRGSLDASAKNYLKHDQRHHHRGGRLQQNGRAETAAAL